MFNTMRNKKKYLCTYSPELMLFSTFVLYFNKANKTFLIMLVSLLTSVLFPPSPLLQLEFGIFLVQFIFLKEYIHKYIYMNIYPQI